MRRILGRFEGLQFVNPAQPGNLCDARPLISSRAGDFFQLQAATDMGCGSSTPVVASTATTPRELSVRSGTASTPRELSVRSGTASLSSREGTPAGWFLSPGSFWDFNRWLKSLRGAGRRTDPMGRSQPPFQRDFSSHPKYDVLIVLGAASLAIFPSARTRRPRGSTPVI